MAAAAEPIEGQIARLAQTMPERVAVEDGKERWTYRELMAAANRLAVDLDRADLAANEPIIVRVSNRVVDVAAFLGVWQAGGVAVPLHRTVPEMVAGRTIARIGARFAIDESLRDLATEPPPARPLLDGAGTIVFTSGSTGEPKGVVLSAERTAGKLEMIAEMTAWRAGDATLIPLQLTFSFGQWTTWLTLTRGGRAVLRGRFDDGEARALLRAGGIDRFAVVPTMLRRLTQHGGIEEWGGTFMAGGEPLPAALGGDLRQAFPAAGLGDIFGLSETGTSDFFVQPGAYDRLAGTIGFAGQGIEHRLLANGELSIRSPWRMLGYLDGADLTASAYDDGYFKTGDLVHRRTDGALELIGRANDLIVRAGNKIAPLEIEAVFLTHEGVAAALAAGVGDEERGEALHLAVVARPGYELEPSRLRAWASERLERFKLPDAIHIMAELPTGGTGKTDRRVLRRLIEGFESSAGELD